MLKIWNHKISKFGRDPGSHLIYSCPFIKEGDISNLPKLRLNDTKMS